MKLDKTFLTRILNNDTSIKEVLIHETITKEDFQLLAQALENNTNVNTLKVCNCDINYQEIVFIAQILQTNKSIKKAFFSDNEISSAALKELVKTLISNKTLTHLDLGYNPVNNDDAYELVCLLKTNRCLISLEFSHRYTFDAIGLGGSVTIEVSPTIITQIKELLFYNQEMQSKSKYFDKNYFFGDKIPLSFKQELTTQIALLEIELKYIRFDNDQLVQLLAFKHLQTSLEYNKSESEVAHDCLTRFPEVFNTLSNDPRKQFIEQFIKTNDVIVKPKS